MSATDEGFTNQQKAEPFPPTPAHDPQDMDADSEESGSETGVAHPAAAPGMPAVAQPGRPDGEVAT